MEQNDSIKQKQERFKALGIPIPIEKPAFDQPVTNVKDPKMLQRIQEIKNGAKKTEFNEMLHVGDKKGFKPLPEPKRKNHNPQQSSETKAPALESFSPVKSSGGDLDIYEKLFSGESTSAPVTKGGSGQRINEDINTDSTGSDFLSNFRQKLQAKAMSNGVSTQPSANSSGFGFKTQYETPQISSDEIESKIYEISSQVAKKIAEETIKEVLDQYLSKKTKLNENTFQKVKEDVIKIGDKYYKLTPVTIKQKTK
jgi:hypothetical protein